MLHTKIKDCHYDFMSGRSKNQGQVCEGVNCSQGVGRPNPIRQSHRLGILVEYCYGRFKSHDLKIFLVAKQKTLLKNLFGCNAPSGSVQAHQSRRGATNQRDPHLSDFLWFESY